MEMTRRSVVIASVAAMAAPRSALAQSASNAPENVAGIPVNYDEAKVGSYTLPDPLKASDGTRVTDAHAWLGKRRPEIVRLFETQQFGVAPGRPAQLAFDVRERDAPAFGGKARRKQVRITFTADRSGPAINFGSNAATLDDPGVDPGTVWDARLHQRVPYKPGGRVFGRIDPVPLLEAGLGFAAFCYRDVDPDAP